MIAKIAQQTPELQ